MSIDILKMLISSACEGGEINEADKGLLRKKADNLGISRVELDKMIAAEIAGKTYTPSIKAKGEQLPNAHLTVSKNKTTPTPPPIPTVKKENISTSVKKEEKPVMPGIFKNEPKKEIKKEVVSNKPTPPIVTNKPKIETPNNVAKKVVTEQKEAKTVSPVVPPVTKKVESVKTNTNNQATEKGKSKLVPILIGVGAVVVIVLFFLFKDTIFGTNKDQANNNKKDNTENVTDNTKNNEDLYEKFMTEGKTAFAGQEFLKSKTAFENALKNKAGDAEATKWVSKLSAVLSLLNEANELFQNKNMIRASLRYDSLLAISPDIKSVAENLKISKDIVANAKTLKLEQGEGKFGFVDNNGNLVVDFKFTDAKDFFGKMAAVKNSVGKWGLIGQDFHKTAKFIVEPKYDDIKQQQSGYICQINGDATKYVFFYRGNQLIERKF